MALLPTLLGLHGGGTVIIPEVAYPTYEVGAVLAGLAVRRTDTPPADAAGVVLVWLNSPGNPHGRVLTDDQLRAWVAWGRAHGVPVVADECYVTLGWDVEPRSLLHPDDRRATTTPGCWRCTRCPSSPTRPATGPACCPATRRWCAASGRCAGTSACWCPGRCRPPWPRPWPTTRTSTPSASATAPAGSGWPPRCARPVLRIDHSEAGLYLWATRDEDCWTTIDWLAGLGIVAAPGSFYGPAGARHVRLALTATDERIAAAVERLQ